MTRCAHQPQVHFLDDFAVSHGEQPHFGHLSALAVDGCIHTEAHHDVIVTVAGKGAFRINIVHGSDVFPTLVLLPHGLNTFPTLTLSSGVAHDFNAISVQLVQRRCVLASGREFD